MWMGRKQKSKEPGDPALSNFSWQKCLGVDREKAGDPPGGRDSQTHSSQRAGREQQRSRETHTRLTTSIPFNKTWKVV